MPMPPGTNLIQQQVINHINMAAIANAIRL